MSDQMLRLDKGRHIKYWTRCLKTFLPHHYTSAESNRMYLAYLIISALDILDCLETITTQQERCDYINWIYHCQHPQGGFRMWPGTDFGARATAANARWDPAHVPATYFALCTLVILGDDLRRVRRRETLSWLRAMQRADGSFGETHVAGCIEGGRDPRFAYCAAGVRYILRGRSHSIANAEEDINVDALVQSLRAVESHEGGIAEEPYHEPQAGYTFCALGALALVGRLSTTTKHTIHDTSCSTGPSDVGAVLKWLVARQTALLNLDDLPDLDSLHARLPPLQISPGLPLSEEPREPSSRQSQEDSLDFLITGMNGRANKVADTCYAWWVGASLQILGKPQVYDHAALRRYLLGRTQHPALGGFGKAPGDVPDLHHSYLGLAALGLSSSVTEGKERDVKAVDGELCISQDAKRRLPGLWKAWEES